jgi:hypothetical protein
MADDVSTSGLLRGVGAVGIGAGVLALFPPLAATVSRTTVLLSAGSRCGSAAGLATIHQLDDGNPFAAEETAARNLRLYEAAVWLPTTDEVCAEADTTDGWAWYGSLVGAYVATHNGRQQATLVVEDAVPPVTGHSTRPDGVTVFMRVDTPPRTGDADHPVTWWHDAGAGRARYSGHDGSFSDTLFMWLPLPDLRVAVRAVPSERQPALPNRPGRRLRSGNRGRRVQ